MRICASRCSFTKNHYMMHGQQNVKKTTEKSDVYYLLQNCHPCVKVGYSPPYQSVCYFNFWNFLVVLSRIVGSKVQISTGTYDSLKVSFILSSCSNVAAVFRSVAFISSFSDTVQTCRFKKNKRDAFWCIAALDSCCSEAIYVVIYYELVKCIRKGFIS